MFLPSCWGGMIGLCQGRLEDLVARFWVVMVVFWVKCGWRNASPVSCVDGGMEGWRLGGSMCYASFKILLYTVFLHAIVKL